MTHAPRSAARRRQSGRAKILSDGVPLRQYTQLSAGVLKSLVVYRDVAYQVVVVHAKIKPHRLIAKGDYEGVSLNKPQGSPDVSQAA
jgi:hypothetical protein